MGFGTMPEVNFGLCRTRTIRDEFFYDKKTEGVGNPSVVSCCINLRLLIGVGDLDDPRRGFSLRLLASATTFFTGDPADPEHTSSNLFVTATPKAYERHLVPPA